MHCLTDWLAVTSLKRTEGRAKRTTSLEFGRVAALKFKLTVTAALWCYLLLSTQIEAKVGSV
jgi:hypothetical protein